MGYNVAMPVATLKLKKAFLRAGGSVAELVRTKPFHRRAAIASGVLLILAVALPVWRIVPHASDRPFIPLHYNVYVGVDAFGAWYQVFVPALFGAAALAVNLGIQAWAVRREPALAAFLAIATIAVEAVVLVATVLTVLLNI